MNPVSNRKLKTQTIENTELRKFVRQLRAGSKKVIQTSTPARAAMTPKKRTLVRKVFLGGRKGERGSPGVVLPHMYKPKPNPPSMSANTIKDRDFSICPE
jgi:type IV secretory pathway ATPase VirB11/archaellum biosynthesis ATPase